MGPKKTARTIVLNKMSSLTERLKNGERLLEALQNEGIWYSTFYKGLEPGELEELKKNAPNFGKPRDTTKKRVKNCPVCGACKCNQKYPIDEKLLSKIGKVDQ